MIRIRTEIAVATEDGTFTVTVDYDDPPGIAIVNRAFQVLWTDRYDENGEPEEPVWMLWSMLSNDTQHAIRGHIGDLIESGRLARWAEGQMEQDMIDRGER